MAEDSHVEGEAVKERTEGEGETGGAGGSVGSEDSKGAEAKVRTLFLTGFPPDVRHREVHNLLRFLKGYDNCVLNLRGKSPVAFAAFSSAEDAVSARDQLHGIHLDEDAPQYELRAQLAKQDSHIKPKSGPGTTSAGASLLGLGGGGSGSGSITITGAAAAAGAGKKRGGSDEATIDKRARGGAPFAAGASGITIGYGHAHTPMPIQVRPTIGYATHPHPHSHPHPAYPPMAMYSTAPPPRPRAEAKESVGGKSAPNTTLFFANFGVSATESEVNELMSNLGGFRRMRWSAARPGASAGPVVFVDFSDIDSAATALASLQGHNLASSDPARGGLRVEYAKSKMVGGSGGGGGGAGAGAGGAGASHPGLTALASPIAVYGAAGYTPFPGFGAPSPYADAGFGSYDQFGRQG